MTTRMKYAAISIAAATLLLSGQAIAQAPIEISIAHLGASTGPAIAGSLGPLKDALEKTGKVQVTMYGAGSPYANATKFSEVVENGVVDMAFGVQEIEAGRYPLNTLFGKSFIVSDIEKASRAYMKMLKSTPELAKEFGNLHVLSVAVVGPDQLHSRVPIDRLEDLKGKRVMAANPSQVGVLRELGASAVVLPRTASYENLQKGVVDAVIGTYITLDTFNLYEVSCCHFDWNLAVAPIYLVMNKKKYESLPPDVKKVINSFTGEDAAVAIANVWTRGIREALSRAKAKNHKFGGITPSQQVELQKQFKPQTDERLEALEKRGLPAKAVFEKAVAAIKAEEAK